MPDPVYAPWATAAVFQVLGDVKFLYLLSDLHTSSALTMSAGSTRPELAQGVGEHTRCPGLVAPASCSLAEVEVAERKQRSARWMDGHSGVPEGRENVEDAVEVEVIVACHCAGCTSLSVGSFRAPACNDSSSTPG